MPTKFTIEGREIDGQEKVVEWIRSGLTKEAILYAEQFGKHIAPRKKKNPKTGKEYVDSSKSLSASQIRNVYGEILRMKMKGFNLDRFLLLKPRLTYAAARNNTEGSRDFKEVFVRAIDAVLEAEDENEQAQRFERFADFFEAVLAYHRANGGK